MNRQLKQKFKHELTALLKKYYASICLGDGSNRITGPDGVYVFFWPREFGERRGNLKLGRQFPMSHK